MLKLMLLDVLEFVMEKKQVMMKLLLKLYLMVKDNAKIIAGMIRDNLMELGYDFRD